ncbi:hypothetical protein [Ruminococcus albus]|uniref:DUF3592 domain-containing protein n=1 Tax=Ruminococcus albus 8 TaxID=246199 RepID=E9SAP7_RUMAL|nr:hypothetical protein [Ruminococcus albus]EGC03674.1 hypothetical protein CUS_8009 [Ruminococcus albus 8]MCC3349874.1 hypothetical protein [Ruminococcus albus 8]
MSTKKVLIVIFTALMVLVSTVALVVGISAFRLIKRCTESVSAEFIGYDIVKRSSTGKSSYKNYYPKFRYEYGGKLYEVTGSNTYARDKAEGYVQEIYIDPDSPEDFIDPENNNKLIPTICVAAGIFMDILALYLIIDAVKNGK